MPKECNSSATLPLRRPSLMHEQFGSRTRWHPGTGKQLFFRSLNILYNAVRTCQTIAPPLHPFAFAEEMHEASVAGAIYPLLASAVVAGLPAKIPFSKQ
jgi:hypothetical protein